MATNPSSNILAIDLGGTSCKLAVFSQEGELQLHCQVPTTIFEAQQLDMEELLEQVDQTLAAHGYPDRDYCAVGLGCPGWIDQAQGTVTGAYNLGWQTSQPVRAQVADHFGCPVFLDNDANLAALAEYYLGAGRAHHSLVLITLGTGIGSGIIVGFPSDADKLQAPLLLSGEVGHLPLSGEYDFPCTCGNAACLETVASANGLLRVYHHERARWEGPFAADYQTAEAIFEAFYRQEPLAVRVVEIVAAYLGQACAILANTIGPEVILLGGGMSRAADSFYQLVESAMQAGVYPPLGCQVRLERAQYQDQAGIYGAYYLAIHGLKSLK